MDLTALRRRFMEELAARKVPVDGSDPLSILEAFDADAGRMVVRAEATASELPVRIEITIEALSGAYGALVANGEEVFGPGGEPDDAALTWLDIMFMEATESAASVGATDLVLSPQGTLERRGSARSRWRP